jgi:hypothetical protein
VARLRQRRLPSRAILSRARASLRRDFFLSFLAAKYVGVSFEDFRDKMEGREETDAFFAWRKACAAGRR